MLCTPLQALTMGDMMQPQKTTILHNIQEEGWDFTLKEVILTQELYLPSTDDWERISSYKRNHEDSLILFVRYKVNRSIPTIHKTWSHYELTDGQRDTKAPSRVMTFDKWLNLYTADGQLIKNVFQTISTNADKDTIAIVEAPVKTLLGAKLGWNVRYFNVGEHCTSGNGCKRHEYHFKLDYNDQYVLLPESEKQFFAPLNITYETNIETYISKKWIIGPKTPETIKREEEESRFNLKMRELEYELNNLMNSL